MYYKEFKDMTKVHPEGASKDNGYAIFHAQASEADSWNPEYAGQKNQLVCVLKDKNEQEIVMSDSWMEQETNIELIREAHGHVLIGGLGIGMILLAMQDRPEILSITVVEISQELHDFIVPNLELNDKVKIVISDIHDFEPKRFYDFVYCDIWNDTSGDNLEEMQELTDKFDGCDEVRHWRYDKTVGLANEDFYYG